MPRRTGTRTEARSVESAAGTRTWPLHPVNRSGSVAHAARDLSVWSAKMEIGLPGALSGKCPPSPNAGQTPVFGCENATPRKCLSGHPPGARMACRDRGRLGHRANARMGEFGADFAEEHVDHMGCPDRAQRS